MHSGPIGFPIKKREWVFGTAAAFLLSAAYYLFRAGDAGAALRDGVFWEFLCASGAYFAASALVHTLSLPWIPAAAAVLGTALPAVFLKSMTPLCLFLFLPALLLQLFARFVMQETSRRSVLPHTSLALSVLLLGTDVYLLVRVCRLGYGSDYLNPRHNAELSGFFVLAAMFIACAVLIAVFERRARQTAAADAKTGKRKKRNARGKRPETAVSLRASYAPLLLFFCAAALSCVLMWDRDEKQIPYAMLGSLSALLTALSVFCAVPAAQEP